MLAAPVQLLRWANWALRSQILQGNAVCAPWHYCLSFFTFTGNIFLITFFLLWSFDGLFVSEFLWMIKQRLFFLFLTQLYIQDTGHFLSSLQSEMHTVSERIRVTEYSGLGKGPTRIIELHSCPCTGHPHNPTIDCVWKHCPKASGTLAGLGLLPALGEPDHCLGEEPFPNVQHKLHWSCFLLLPRHHFLEVSP